MAKLREAARLLKAGEVVAFPTETVYGLGANALGRKGCRKNLFGQGQARG